MKRFKLFKPGTLCYNLSTRDSVEKKKKKDEEKTNNTKQTEAEKMMQPFLIKVKETYYITMQMVNNQILSPGYRNYLRDKMYFL